MTNGAILNNGGLQYVPQIAVQYVYLDFDGELTSYNGEILALENVEVQHSSLTEERINNIVTALNGKYVSQNVVFVTERPQSVEYSTIFIGKTTAFDSYGNFAGLAETIDEGNANKSDNAFVNLDTTATDSQIIATISHETDHLLGTLDHGGDGLAAYAAGKRYDVSSGVTSTGIKLSWDSMYVSSGGTANCTTVNAGGYLYVSSGGTANSTTVNYRGHLYVSSGGTANCTTVNSSCGLGVYSGGTANSTTVNSGGSLNVSSGGNAYKTTLRQGGWLGCFSFAEDKYFENIVNGKTFLADNVYIVGDSMHVSTGGTANGTTVDFGGYLYVYSGGTVNSTTVNDWQSHLNVLPGGTANNTTVNSNCYLDVSSGGTANSTTLDKYSYLTVSSGGTANNTTVNGGGDLRVYSGGTANSTTVNYGWLRVSSGGTANSTTVNDGGRLWACADGTANSTTVNWSGVLYVYPGGTANSTTVNDGGHLIVSAGGIANSTTVNSGGYLCVSSGGNAYKTTLLQGGQLGGFSFTEDKYFEKIVNGKTFLADNVYIVGNSMHVYSGGTANSTTVNNGVLYVYDRGTANSTTMSGGGLVVYDRGTANSTTVNKYGNLEVFFGGTANSTTVNSGNLRVSSGGIANNTTVNDGYLYVESGGTANNTTLNRMDWGDCILRVSSGGIANSTTVNSGGYLSVSSGGTLRGALQIAEGAYIEIYAGAKIDFTVNKRSAADGYLINDISRLGMAPTYTITVSADQAFGKYKLAQGAENFTGSISIGDSTVRYGEITVNGSVFEYGNRKYSLKESEGDLTLSIMDKDALIGNSDGVTFPRFGNGIVQYSRNNFENVLSLKVEGEDLDSYGLPKGTYQWQVSKDGKNWTKGEDIVSQKAPAAEKFISDADGCTDIFFANASGNWSVKYAAEHQTTGETVALAGKNRLDDIFKGSADANVLVLTDDSNGDALFVDDVYTALGDQARFSQIDEIRAGAGDDIVDMTSQRFEYEGDGITIYGGAGNDTLWANKGSNTLFGDAGDDRLVGASGNDYIIGGAGNDSMSGGGGNDIFCFGGDWGKDTVEQLSGSVTLWFDEGSNANWNSKTKTYSDGANSVTVSGNVNVTLKFGADASLPEGAFLEAASEKIFEDKNKGMIA